MKRLLLFIQLLFLTIFAHATGQESDIIFIDGVQWNLLGRPVCADSLLYSNLKAVLPENRPIVTSNWDGFTSYWSVKQDILCLDSIRCVCYENGKMVSERIPNDTMLRVFKQYVEGDRIVAGWLTGKIRVATGKMIYYMHTGFERNYEEEQIISIDKGKVSELNEFHNYIVDGFSFDKYNPQHYDLRKMFPLHIEQYPELADTKRIVFRIKRARVNSQGNLVECELEIIKPNDNPRLAAEIVESLKAYHPWKVLFVNGEFRAYGIEGYTVPYIIEQ